MAIGGTPPRDRSTSQNDAARCGPACAPNRRPWGIPDRSLRRVAASGIEGGPDDSLRPGGPRVNACTIRAAIGCTLVERRCHLRWSSPRIGCQQARRQRSLAVRTSSPGRGRRLRIDPTLSGRLITRQGPRTGPYDSGVSRDDAIPLRILIVDQERDSARVLTEILRQDERVDRLITSDGIAAAQTELRSGDLNTIFIDPISLGLDGAVEFIFSVRKATPEIVFVLFGDQSQIEARRAEFFAGTRQRLAHYYRLDKQTPMRALPDEVDAVLNICISDLSWRLSAESLKRIRASVVAKATEAGVAADIESQLNAAISLVTPAPAQPRTKHSVFLSHRFAETEYVTGLTQFLQKAGFEIVIGAPTNTYISQAILQRIMQSDYFCV